MLKRTLITLIFIAWTGFAAEAASLSKTYAYFSVRGSTLDEIEAELSRRGPEVKTSGRRHPGATRMSFTTKIGYGQAGGFCRVVQANVMVRAKVILPKWRRVRSAASEVKLIWDTLASDIKRHEESHVVIAKNHARELEQTLMKITRQPDCKTASVIAKSVSARVLAAHDRAQEAFDRVEGINFEARLTRLLHYRLQHLATSGNDG